MVAVSVVRAQSTRGVTSAVVLLCIRPARLCCLLPSPSVKGEDQAQTGLAVTSLEAMTAYWIFRCSDLGTQLSKYVSQAYCILETRGILAWEYLVFPLSSVAPLKIPHVNL